MGNLVRLWDKFLTWLWWPAVKETIEGKKKRGEPSNQRNRYGADLAS